MEDTEETAEDDNTEASSSLSDDNLESSSDLFVKDEGFDLYKEFKAIHNKVHDYVLAGKYPVEEYTLHLNAFWIPDWMLSKKIIFNLPPLTYSDMNN